MLLGFKPQDNIFIYLTKDRERFELKLGYIPVFVPSRDGCLELHETLFDLRSLLRDRKVAYGTTSDEAFAAIKYLRSLPPTDEFDLAINDLKAFLDSKRNQRKNEYLIKMIDLYGSENGLTLFNAIKERQFRFPAFQLRENATANLINRIMKEFPGASSGYHHTSNYRSILDQAHRLGGSKFRSMLVKVVEQTPLMEQRLDTAIQAVKYLETRPVHYSTEDLDRHASKLEFCAHW